MADGVGGVVGEARRRVERIVTLDLYCCTTSLPSECSSAMATLVLADAAVTQSTAASLARRVKIIKRMQYLRPRPIPAIRRDVRGPEHGMEWPNHVLAASTRRLCHLRLDGFDHEGMLLDAYWIASDKFSKGSGSLESAEA